LGLEKAETLLQTKNLLFLGAHVLLFLVVQTRVLLVGNTRTRRI
jgi:hypothetical protein